MENHIGTRRDSNTVITSQVLKPPSHGCSFVHAQSNKNLCVVVSILFVMVLSIGTHNSSHPWVVFQSENNSLICVMLMTDLAITGEN